MSVSLSQRNVSKCERYLKSLHSILTVKEDGSISFKNIDSDRSWLTLITDLIKVPEHQRHFDLSSIIRQCAFDMKREEIKNAHELINRINNALNKLVKRKSQFSLWTKITVNRGNFHKSVRFSFERYNIYIGNNLPKRLQSSHNYVVNHASKKIEPSGLCFLWISGSFSSELVAGSYLSEILDKFASIMDFLLVGNKWTYIEAEPPRPKSLVRTGRLFFLVDSSNKAFDFHWYNPMFSPEPSSTSYKYLSEIRDIYKNNAALLMKNISSLPHDISQKIWNVLAILHGAWESADKTYRLVRMWSAIEILFSDETKSTKIDLVIKRASFSSTDPEHRKDILYLIYKFRNQYMHQGQSSHSLDYLLNEATAQIWNSILWIIRSRSNLKSHSDLLNLLDMPVDRQSASMLRKNAALAFKMIDQRRPVTSS